MSPLCTVTLNEEQILSHSAGGVSVQVFVPDNWACHEGTPTLSIYGLGNAVFMLVNIIPSCLTCMLAPGPGAPMKIQASWFSVELGGRKAGVKMWDLISWPMCGSLVLLFVSMLMHVCVWQQNSQDGLIYMYKCELIPREKTYHPMYHLSLSIATLSLESSNNSFKFLMLELYEKNWPVFVSVSIPSGWLWYRPLK